MVETQNNKRGMLCILELIRTAGKVESKTKLQKMMFLAKEDEKVNHGYFFEKYLYGPFSFDVSSDLNALERFGLIRIERTTVNLEDNEVERFSFSLTSEGLKFLEESKNILEDVDVEGIHRIVGKWNAKTLNEILDYAYKKVNKLS